MILPPVALEVAGRGECKSFRDPEAGPGPPASVADIGTPVSAMVGSGTEIGANDEGGEPTFAIPLACGGDGFVGTWAGVLLSADGCNGIGDCSGATAVFADGGLAILSSWAGGVFVGIGVGELFKSVGFNG